MPRRFLEPDMLKGTCAHRRRHAPMGRAAGHQRRHRQPAENRRPQDLRSARPRSEGVVGSKGRRDLHADSRLCRLHGEGRFRGPARSRELRPHARPMPPTCWPTRSRRMAAWCSIAPLSTTIISTGTTPRPTARARPTTSFIRSTASSLPNVIVQIKEGPIDFQAREPVSPLFAGLREDQRGHGGADHAGVHWASSAISSISRRCGSRCSISICARRTVRRR